MRILKRALGAVISLALCASVSAIAAEPVFVTVNGNKLAVLDQGSGPAVILLHGGLGDYNGWQPQVAVLASKHRVISYSRRYANPNNLAISTSGWTIHTDVDDLNALVASLGLRQFDLIGQSAGAFVALEYALEHPTIVRKLVISEPPVHQLIRTSQEGEDAYQAFMTTIWNPAREFFREHETDKAMRIFVNGIAGEDRFDTMDPAARAANMRNARTMEAHALSTEPFPVVAKQRLQRLRVPTLIVTGAKTIRIHRLVDEELARLIPNARSVIIPDSGHGSPRENAPAFNAAMIGFLDEPAASTIDSASAIAVHTERIDR
jgi:pimeloyl-ACP methyl ester carboxylesterase